MPYELVDGVFSLEGINKVTKAIAQKHQVDKYFLLLLFLMVVGALSFHLGLFFIIAAGFASNMRPVIELSSNIEGINNFGFFMLVSIFTLVCVREVMLDHHKRKIRFLMKEYGYQLHQDDFCTILNEYEHTKDLSDFLIDNSISKDIVDFIWQTTWTQLKLQIQDREVLLQKRSELTQYLYTEFLKLIPKEYFAQKNILARIHYRCKELYVQGAQVQHFISSLPLLIDRIEKLVQPSPSKQRGAFQMQSFTSDPMSFLRVDPGNLAEHSRMRPWHYHSSAAELVDV